MLVKILSNEKAMNLQYQGMTRTGVEKGNKICNKFIAISRHKRNNN